MSFKNNVNAKAIAFGEHQKRCAANLFISIKYRMKGYFTIAMHCSRLQL